MRKIEVCFDNFATHKFEGKKLKNNIDKCKGNKVFKIIFLPFFGGNNYDVKTIFSYLKITIFIQKN